MFLPHDIILCALGAAFGATFGVILVYKKLLWKMAELRRIREDLEDAHEIAGLGSYCLDVATKTWTSSKIFDKIVGIDSSFERSSSSWASIIHKDDWLAMEDYLTNHVLIQHHDFDKEYRIIRNGETIRIHGRGKLKFNDGIPTKLVGTIQDITERSSLQLQLHQAQKMESLGVLAGGIAHDMNNVLGAILGLASAHLELNTEGTPTYRAFSTIIKAATRGSGVVKSLLAFSRQSPAEERKLDINQVISEQVDLLKYTTLAKVNLVTNLASDLKLITGDANALAHMFINLCVNSVDSLNLNDGVISITTRNLDFNWIEVIISDNGSGMSKEILAKALSPFFTTKAVGKGTGLGLPLVFNTVKIHGGKMDITSEPGVGTDVILKFPTVEDSYQAASVPKSFETKPLDIMLVDDDELVQSMIKSTLELLGHRVTVAASGEDAILKVSGGYKPDTILMDINMPGMGGARATLYILELLPNIPVIISTGKVDQTVVDLVQNNSSVVLLPKPYSKLDLQEVLIATTEPKISQTLITGTKS